MPSPVILLFYHGKGPLLIVLFCSSECAPYASTGGLADVSASLPAAIAARGHTVYRMMPAYRKVLSGEFELEREEVELSIPVGFRHMQGEVLRHVQDGVTTFFIRRDEFFDRSELYSTAVREYDDNAERFIFFQKAVVEIMDVLGLNPDVVHCNDWQTGLIPMYLIHGTRGQGRGVVPPTVFTIHNLAYQGLYPASAFPETGLPFSCFSLAGMEYYGNMSFLKAGLVTSTRITTVSPTYAEEIQTPEMGFGLDGVLRERSSKLVGILNGMDTEVWDPSTDPALAENYSLEDLAGKKACKAALQKRMGLKEDSSIPLLGMIARLVDQKGFDLLALAMKDILSEPVQFVVLGSGQKEYEDLVKQWQTAYPGQFSAEIGFNIDLSHQIEAGADLFLMPSVFEPCGLNQLYSLRYGTPTLAFATGGLADTVEPVSLDGQGGTGFVFYEYDAASLLFTLRHALELYRDRSIWKSIMRRGMAIDNSWSHSAERYEEIYQDVQA